MENKILSLEEFMEAKTGKKITKVKKDKKSLIVSVPEPISSVTAEKRKNINESLPFRKEKIIHGHSSPYNHTSKEELDKLEKTNPDLYSAIINWN